MWVLLYSASVDLMESFRCADGFPKVGPYTGCFLTKAPSVVIIVAYLLVLFTETSECLHPSCYPHVTANNALSLVIVGLTAFKAIQHCMRSFHLLKISAHYHRFVTVRRSRAPLVINLYRNGTHAFQFFHYSLLNRTMWPGLVFYVYILRTFTRW